MEHPQTLSEFPFRRCYFRRTHIPCKVYKCALLFSASELFLLKRKFFSVWKMHKSIWIGIFFLFLILTVSSLLRNNVLLRSRWWHKLYSPLDSHSFLSGFVRLLKSSNLFSDIFLQTQHSSQRWHRNKICFCLLHPFDIVFLLPACILPLR